MYMPLPVYLQFVIGKCDSMFCLALHPLRGGKAVLLQQAANLIPAGLQATAQVLATSTAALQSLLLHSINAANCTPTLTWCSTYQARVI